MTILKGARAVQPFDRRRYLGTWYEMTRFDFRFEKNLSDVSAIYSLNPDGSIRVANKGYDVVKTRLKESIGKAKPVKEENLGRLKVAESWHSKF